MRQLFGLRSWGLAVVTSCIVGLSPTVFAANFPMPDPGNNIIGDINYISTSWNETPAMVGQRFNVGQNSIIAANPGVGESRTMPSGMFLKVPTRFILPPLARKGIVVNLPEMRLYYYPEGSNQVMTFPIGIGRIGKTIPIANTLVTNKVENPSWRPPEDIREFNRQQGIELPEVMPAGPDNPLGPYAIYLKLPTYLIHSTIFPESIGRRASFGCIRMNETDIKQFYPLVTPGTPVAIVDIPNKVGWEGDHLYLEAHPPLEERVESADFNNILASIDQNLPKGQVTLVNWQVVSYLATQPDGVPHDIGFRVAR